MTAMNYADEPAGTLVEKLTIGDVLVIVEALKVARRSRSDRPSNDEVDAVLAKLERWRKQ